MESQVNAPAQKQPTPIVASKMKLSALVRGKQQQPIRAVVFGPEGCGKSTFASNAPAPIFLGTEDGTAQLDVTRFPAPSTWADVLEAVRVLTVEEHEFQTLVVDTLDWAEPLVWKFLCQREGAPSVEEIGGGYGKGYTAALDEWRILLAAIERMQKAKPMHVLLLAHSHIKSFKNPEGPDWERYELKLNQKAAGVMKEWSDAVLFANYETFAVADKAKRVRGVSTGNRLLYTERTAGFDAKNRYGLPSSLPLSWPAFEAAVKAGQPADPKVLLEEIQRKAAGLMPAEQEKVAAAVGRAAGDAVKLSQLNDYVNAKTAEQAEKEK